MFCLQLELFIFFPTPPSPTPPPHALQGQADLLQRSKAEVQENMKQVHDGALAGNLAKGGGGVRRVPRSVPRRGPEQRAGGASATWTNEREPS